MINLKRVGYWREDPEPPSMLSAVLAFARGELVGHRFADALANLPWPGDLVDKTWDSGARLLVTQYVNDERFKHIGYLGYSHCRLCPLPTNGTSDYSDGVYVWPEGFGHYIEAHGVRPPAEFVAHVIARLQ